MNVQLAVPKTPSADERARGMVADGTALASEVNGEQVTVYQPTGDHVVLSDGKTGVPRQSFFKRVMLPENFPTSVHEDYAPHRKWQFIRDVSAGMTSFYATSALVGAMGFGEIGPLSAGMTWMIRDAVDGVGKMGASLIAHKADKDPRAWFVKGEVFAGVGSLAETTLLLAPQTFPITAPLANICKALGTGTKNAASAAIEKHQALGNNLGDLRSKNGNQSMLASALGAGLAIAGQLVGERFLGPAAVPLLAVGTTALALFAQKKSVDVLQIYDITESGLRSAVRDWVKEGQLPGPGPSGGFFTWFPTPGGMFSNETDVKLGCSLEEITRDKAHFDELRSWYRDRRYMLDFDGKDNVQIALHPEAQPRDLVAAMVQAELLTAARTSQTFKELSKNQSREAARDWAIKTSLRAAPTDSQGFLEKLERLGWSTERILLSAGQARVTWQPGPAVDLGGPMDIKQFQQEIGA
ncbi:hypothetical protein DYH09_06110 [bacterium CPR1]|nr:hypothetical protein [bacterium CPR1]